MRAVARFEAIGVFASVLAVLLNSGLIAFAEDRPDKVKTKAKKVSLNPASRPIMIPPDPHTLQAMLLMHNDVRARNGLPPLKLDPKLTAAAQRYAEYSLRRHKFGHHADGNSPTERISAEGLVHNAWAENIGWGHTSPVTVMQAWMRSTGHRRNILDGFTYVGFGRAGNKWVTLFANPVEQADTNPELVEK
jgi:uncharacterized protein YkwD